MKMGDIETVHWLIRRGADLGALTSFNETVPMLAAQRGLKETFLSVDPLSWM